MMKKNKKPVNNDSNIGTIKVLNVKENKDGSAEYIFEVDDVFVQLYKREKNVKRATKKGVGDFILELLEKSVEREDGYKMVRKNKE